MSTHVTGFQSFFRDFASFCMAKLAVMFKAGGNAIFTFMQVVANMAI